MGAPEAYCKYLTAHGYNSRSSKHGDFLAQAFLADLLDHSKWLRGLASKREVVYKLNHDVQLTAKEEKQVGSAEARKDLAWNIDLAIGPGEVGSWRRDYEPLVPEERMAFGTPTEEWLMLDAKGVMTEHGKARRNRQRDATALWAVMHSFLPDAVVGAIVPINIAKRFRSSLKGKSITIHNNIERMVEDTLSVFRAVQVRTADAKDTGIEGLGCFVISYSNLPGARARLSQTYPAPKKGDSVHYETFLESIARQLEVRNR